MPQHGLKRPHEPPGENEQQDEDGNWLEEYLTQRATESARPIPPPRQFSGYEVSESPQKRRFGPSASLTDPSTGLSRHNGSRDAVHSSRSSFPPYMPDGSVEDTVQVSMKPSDQYGMPLVRTFIPPVSTVECRGGTSHSPVRPEPRPLPAQHETALHFGGPQFPLPGVASIGTTRPPPSSGWSMSDRAVTTGDSRRLMSTHETSVPRPGETSEFSITELQQTTQRSPAASRAASHDQGHSHKSAVSPAIKGRSSAAIAAREVESVALTRVPPGYSSPEAVQQRRTEEEYAEAREALTSELRFRPITYEMDTDSGMWTRVDDAVSGAESEGNANVSEDAAGRAAAGDAPPNLLVPDQCESHWTTEYGTVHDEGTVPFCASHAHAPPSEASEYGSVSILPPIRLTYPHTAGHGTSPASTFDLALYNASAASTDDTPQNFPWTTPSGAD